MFTYSICEPLNPEILEKGSVSPEEFRQILKEFPWLEMLRELEAADQDKIQYSPSLELKNTETFHGITVSIVGPEEDLEYYIFFIRPKTIKKRGLFKTKEEFHEKYVSDRTGQSLKDAHDAFEALLSGDHETLENRWG